MHSEAQTAKMVWCCGFEQENENRQHVIERNANKKTTSHFEESRKRTMNIRNMTLMISKRRRILSSFGTFTEINNRSKHRLSFAQNESKIEWKPTIIRPAHVQNMFFRACDRSGIHAKQNKYALLPFLKSFLHYYYWRFTCQSQWSFFRRLIYDEIPK